MKDMVSHANSSFDHYALNYDAALESGIAVSGEDKEFFAKGRIAWLANCLSDLHEKPKTILDFGCGTGSSVPHFFEMPGGVRVVGIDTSSKLLEVARQVTSAYAAQYFLKEDYLPTGDIDIAFCNGVFHHIPPNYRSEAVRYIHDCLRPRGLFAFWENNPWNPGTRYIMSRIPFDRDAITLSYREACRLLKNEGFEVVRTDFLFIFPRVLRWFRRAEPVLAKVPIGAQYQVLCRKL